MNELVLAKRGFRLVQAEDAGLEYLVADNVTGRCGSDLRRLPP
jgi:hypothetical protein